MLCPCNHREQALALPQGWMLMAVLLSRHCWRLWTQRRSRNDWHYNCRDLQCIEAPGQPLEHCCRQRHLAPVPLLGIPDPKCNGERPMPTPRTCLKLLL